MLLQVVMAYNLKKALLSVTLLDFLKNSKNATGSYFKIENSTPH